MANSFDSNITRKLARVFLPAFESKRILSKTVNTQFLKNAPFNPSSGTVVDIKRPTDYVTVRTSGGDVSGSAPNNDIITGKASATVQNYFTVDMEWDVVDEAIKMDQLKELIDPAADRIVTDLELDFGKFMYKNVNLSVGDPDTAVTTWDEVAEAGALMDAIGVPSANKHYVINPFTQRTLASVQRSIGAADPLVSSAFQNATIAENFAGMKVMTGNALSSYTAGTLTTRTGTLSATPDATYVTAKDTMTQSLALTGLLPATGTIKAGEIIEITDNSRNRLGLNTREQLSKDGAAIKWRGVVTADVTLSGGAGTVVVAGPAINESGGQYNTVSSALTSGDAIEILGTASTVYMPNMFYHKDAFAIGSVPIPKLYATDTVMTTRDGLQMRVSKGADILKNKQIVRFDLQPAYGVLNPFFAGQGFGNP
jgi:hypothetical protein